MEIGEDKTKSSIICIKLHFNLLGLTAGYDVVQMVVNGEDRMVDQITFMRLQVRWSF